MLPRFLIFIAVITAVLSLACLYLGFRSITILQLSSRSRLWVWLGLLGFVLLQLIGPYTYRITGVTADRPLYLQWVVYLLLGVFATSFFFMLFYDLSWKLWTSFHPVEVDLQRRGFLALLAASAGSVLVGWAQAASGPTVYDVEIPIEGLPQELEGYRIVQITDLHVGPLVSERYAEKVVGIANTLKADLIALTGDFVDGSVESIGSHVAPLARLQARDGIYFTTGNHEYYSGVFEWMEYFKKIGFHVLVNEHRIIERGSARIAIAGVPDTSAAGMVPSHSYDPARAIAGVPDGVLRVLLAHRPVRYEEAESLGFQLQLSGHTHGGQFFPWSVVVALAHRFHVGLRRWKRMWIYTSRGTGYWGPPNRFAIPSEITVLKLTSRRALSFG